MTKMTIYLNSEQGVHHVSGHLDNDSDWNDFEVELSSNAAIKTARLMGKSAIENGDAKTVIILKWNTRRNEWKLIQTYGMTKREKVSAEIDNFVSNMKIEDQFVKYA
jgi:hypothetical protein